MAQQAEANDRTRPDDVQHLQGDMIVYVENAQEGFLEHSMA